MLLLIDTRSPCARVALAEPPVLHTLTLLPPGEPTITGNIYLGVVRCIAPELNAAFVDIGGPKNGFLPLEGNTYKTGQELLVMAEKLFALDKGPRLTTKLALPGEHAVLRPGEHGLRVSKKITGGETIRRLKAFAAPLMPEDCGAMLRTSSADISEQELSEELSSLAAQWARTQQKARFSPAPALVYAEDKLYRAVREALKENPSRIVCTEQVVQDKIAELFGVQAEVYAHQPDLFAFYGLSADFANAFNHKIWLDSGAYITIEHTEALTAVDVNSSRSAFRAKPGIELNVNREAAQELLRQLRLRKISGIVLVDFINMHKEGEKELAQLFDRYRARGMRLSMMGFTRLGLLELSVERTEKPLDPVLFNRYFKGTAGS